MALNPEEIIKRGKKEQIDLSQIINFFMNCERYEHFS